MRALLMFLACWLALPAQAEDLSDLEKAYQKEFAFLVSEQRTLQERLRELDQRKSTEIAQSEREIATMEARLLALQLDADSAEDRLAAVERESEGVAEAMDALAATLAAAGSTLADDDFSLGEPATDLPGQAAQLQQAFVEGMRRIDASRSLRFENGSFFLRDGTQVQGRVAKVGEIAAFGVSEQGSGALLPAGGGFFGLYREPAESTAKALIANDPPNPMSLYLIESAAKRIEEREPKTLGSVLAAGGVVGYVIIGLGLLAVVLVAVRGLTLMYVGRDGGILAKVAPLVRAGKVDEARAVASKAGGALGRVVGASVSGLHLEREALEDVMSEAVLREAPAIERFSTAVMVIAAVAPLLGLLGTVTGMIATFEIITEFGTGDPKMLSGGISEALVTTQLGLVVAIPSLLLGNLTNAWGNNVLGKLEQGALTVVNEAERARASHG